MRASQTLLEDARTVAEDLAEPMQAFAGGTVLLTGANGFLIGFMVDVLAAWNEVGRGAPIRVLALDNNLTGADERLTHLDGRTDVRRLHHDITHPVSLTEPVHWIVHGASIASPSTYRRFPLETLDANVTGTRHLLEFSRAQEGVRGVLVMSTSEIYGDPDATMIPTPEYYRGNVACMGPRACYDESKRLAETLVWIYHDRFGVPGLCVRPFNVYGPGFRLDDGRVLPDFMTAVLAGNPIQLLSDGTPTRAFCYVADAVRAMILLLLDGRGGEAYNVGNDESEISMRDLAHLVAEIGTNETGRQPVKVVFETSDDPAYLVDNPMRRCPDLRKLRSTIDWCPLVPLATGLRRTLRSYRELGLVRAR